MKKITILLFAIAVSFNLLKAQLATFTFNDAPYISAASSHANLSVGNIQLSAGTISTNVTTGAYFTDEPYIEATGGWALTNEADAKYFFVEITAQAGYQFNITNVSYDLYATTAGPSATSILINSTPVYTANVPSAALLSINAPLAGDTKYTQLILKIAGWDNASRSTTGAGAFRIDNLIIEGAVELIPPNDSSSYLTPTAFLVPNEISSIADSAFIPAMEFVLSDSASGDGLSTLIDSLIFTPGMHNQFPNWLDVLSEAKLVCNAYTDTLPAVVGNNTLSLYTTGFSINDGLLNADTCRLLIKLKPNLSEADGKTLGFLLDSAHVFSKPSGSKVGWGKVETDEGKLRMNVEATELKVEIENDMIWKDSLFQLSILAVDVNGNLDKDETGSLQLVLKDGDGELQSSESLIKSFAQGEALFSDLKFTGSDTLSLKIIANNFDDYNLSNLLVTKPLFFDNLESGNLLKWYNTVDWVASPVNPINGDYSIKHNLSGVEGFSYLSSAFGSSEMAHGKTVWRMVLGNGNFDPTSTNRFWYYLMASDSNLLSSTNYGYAVGVNFSGSNDTLSLWKVDSTGNKTLLLASSFDWSENDTLSIEVIREVPENWQLGYSESANFNGLAYTQKALDKSFVDLPFHGLVFQYSSTRAGSLMCDDISVGKLNTPPQITAIQIVAEDTLQLSFSEPVNQEEAENLGNYKVNSKLDTEVILTGVLFNVDYPNKVNLIVNRLQTANYKVFVSKLIDYEGSVMLPDSIEFSYAVPAKRNDVVFTEIMFDPTPVVVLPETDYFEIYNRNNYPFHLGGWKLDIGGTIKTFPDTVIEAGEYITISSGDYKDIFTEYGKFIGLIGSSDLTLTGKSLRLLSNKGVLIDSLFYKPTWNTDEQKTDGGWSLERIDPDNFCSESGNWNASVDEKGGTPGAQNSIFKSNLDTIPPRLTDWHSLSLNHFEFYFNEELDANSLHKNLFLQLNPLAGIMDSLELAADTKTVLVYLSESITADQNYEFTLSGFSDLCGNNFKDTIIEFLYHPAAPFNIVFNEIMADPSPSIGLPLSDYLEIYNRGTYPANLENWELWLGTTRKVFPKIELLPDSFIIVCQTGQSANFSGFGATVELLSSSSLPNTDKALVLKDTTGLVIDSVYYQNSWYQNPDKADGGWSLERIDPNNFCGTLGNWQASENEQGGTPGSLNSVYRTNIDTIPPTLIKASITGYKSIQLVFNEGISTSSVLDFTSVWMAGILTDSIKLNAANATIIDVFLDTTFTSGEVYTFNLKGFTDNCGNAIQDTSIDLLFYLPTVNTIVFNEIMADPSPSVGLPEVNYIELYNRSRFSINLKDWKLKYSTYFRTFQDFVLDSGAYVLLCPTGETELLAPYGNVLDVLSSTTLTISGRLLELADTSGQIISSVNYNAGWYQNPDKANGGWALERIDPNIFSTDSSNWQASYNELGGTPGKINSIKPIIIDTVLPQLISWNMVNTTLFQFVFSEQMQKNLVDSLQFINFSPNTIEIDSFYWDNDLKSFYVFLLNPIQSHQHYNIELHGFTDLSENILGDTIVTFIYNPAKRNDVVFTEIMFDPTPVVGLPEADYLEIYNRSNNPFNLGGWKLDMGGTVKTFPDNVIEEGEYITISSGDYKDIFTEYGKFIGLIGSSDLTLSGKSLRLLSNEGVLIDSLFYKPTWNTDEQKTDGGWSLERIDPDNFCGESSNWNASVDENGGTPGAQNSIFKSNSDTIPPRLTDWHPLSLNHYEFYFNEELDANSIDKNLFLQFNPLAGIVDSLKLGADFKTVSVYLSESIIANQKYEFTLSEFSDLCGNIFEDTIIEFLYHPAVSNDIVFNEIMADPSPSIGLPLSDYLEIYNCSTYPANLENWELWLGNTRKVFPKIELLPDSFLIVCQTGESAAFTGFGQTVELLSSTALPNTDKALVLKDTSGLIIDSVYYQSSWYQNPDKVDGGWSLERIDPDNLCGTLGNWQASENEQGGTPGSLNSVYRTNQDTRKPQVSLIKTDSSIKIEFSELLNGKSLNKLSDFEFENPLLHIDSLLVTNTSSSTVLLFLNQPFSQEGTYTIRIKNIADLCGNTMNDTLFQFEFTIVDPNDLVFSELMVDPSPVIGLPEHEYIELYNRSNRQIDLENWQWVVNGSIKKLPQVVLSPKSYLVILSNSALNEFNFVSNKMIITSFPALPNTSGTMQLLDASGQLVNEIHYDISWYNNVEKDDGGWSLEIIDPDNLCGGIVNWSASANPIGGTPGEINSVDATNIDVTAPKLVETIVASDSALLLQFSEYINEASVATATVFANELGAPAQISIDVENVSLLTLNFEKAFEPHKNYELLLSGINDDCGNEMPDTLINFTYYSAQLYNVVINEIMSNPVPAKGLPESEYIELYNNTIYDIQVYNWTVKIGSSERLLPYFIMEAQSYLVLYNGDGDNPFSPEIKAIGINDLPALPLSGSISLMNTNGGLICQTPYQSAWFTDDFKADGGYSLERIDYNNPAETVQNWQASNANAGGTPGELNSVYSNNPDVTPPDLLRALPLNDSLIALQFSEPMNSAIVTLNEIHIDNQPDWVDIVFTKSNNLSIFYLSLKSKLLAGVTYSIRVSESLTDIAGNAILNRDAKLALPIKASPADVVINELLWNPFDGGVDFVEIYNRSAFPINLKQFLVATYDDTGNIKAPKRITTEGALLFPSAYMVLSENQTLVKQQYWIENPFAFIDVESLPTFSNEEGSMVILDTLGTVIDYLYYTNAMHFSLLENTKGVSLERVQFNRSSQEKSNWHSAAEKAGWATPGYKNSMRNENEVGQESISLERDAFSPDGDGLNDVLYLHYNFGETGYVANITLFDAKGRFVKTLANNELMAPEGVVAWDGTTETGQKAAIGIYIIHVEVFNLEGEVKKYRKVCAVNGRFD